MSDDDVYQKFQCSANTFANVNVNVFYVDSGNFLIGLARCLAFMMFIGFQTYNKILLKRANNVNVIKGLILPSYLPFIYFYMLFSISTGIIELINQAANDKPNTVDSWIYPVEIGITHWFLEGLALFLTRYGAGFVAIRRAFRASFVWGLVTFMFYFIIFSYLNNRFDSDYQRDKSKIYEVFTVYECLMLLFYSAYAFLPPSVLYHRPALTFYARFNVLSYLVVILFATLYYKGEDNVVCPGSIIAFIFAAFLQPLAIYKTLQIDSQYWQGLAPEPGNPLTEVWDHLGIETASSLAENMETFGRYNTKLPILHFGLMNFDTDLTFVAGGFSRVYFGTLRQESVAFKILFAMELDPKDIEEFYREAAVLHKLKHTNVVQCKGVCVMPPALTIVLELCKYGSLFDFLYKAPTVPMAKQRVSLTSRIRQSLVGTRNSIMGVKDADEIEMMSPAAYAAAAALAAKDSDDEEEDEGEFVNNPLSNSNIAHHNALHNSSIINSTTNNNNNNNNNNTINSSSGGRPYSANKASAVTALDVEQGKVRPSSAGLVGAGVGRGAPVDIGGGAGSVRPSVLQKQNSATSTTSNSGNSTSRSGGRTLASIMHDTFGNSKGHGDGSDGTTPRHSLGHARAPLGASLSFRKRLVMMRDAICGIAHLHAQGYMHCDIKSLNFLVAEDFVLKLADMGEARLIDGPPKRSTPPIPALNWAPPEVLVKGAVPEVYTVASDVYGLCIVLAEIINAELPFGDAPSRVSMAKWHEMLTLENVRPPLPEALPTSLRSIITKGWSTDPDMRCTAQDILSIIDEFVIPDTRHSMSSVV